MIGQIIYKDLPIGDFRMSAGCYRLHFSLYVFLMCALSMPSIIIIICFEVASGLLDFCRFQWCQERPNKLLDLTIMTHDYDSHDYDSHDYDSQDMVSPNCGHQDCAILYPLYNLNCKHRTRTLPNFKLIFVLPHLSVAVLE